MSRRTERIAEQLKAEIALGKYSHFGQFDAWRPLNIEGMFNNVSLHRRGN